MQEACPLDHLQEMDLVWAISVSDRSPSLTSPSSLVFCEALLLPMALCLEAEPFPDLPGMALKLRRCRLPRKCFSV